MHTVMGLTVHHPQRGLVDKASAERLPSDKQASRKGHRKQPNHSTAVQGHSCGPRGATKTSSATTRGRTWCSRRLPSVALLLPESLSDPSAALSKASWGIDSFVPAPSASSHGYALSAVDTAVLGVVPGRASLAADPEFSTGTASVVAVSFPYQWSALVAPTLTLLHYVVSTGTNVTIN